MGGQTPNNLALKLSQAGIKILGPSPGSIDCSESRDKFSALLDALHIDQPRWAKAEALADLDAVAKSLGGYPIMVRPSYVLSGAAMRVVFSADKLREFIEQATRLSPAHPVVLSKFETQEEALLKAMLAAGFKMHSKGALLALDSAVQSTSLLEEARWLREFGLDLFATPKTSALLRNLGRDLGGVVEVNEKAAETKTSERRIRLFIRQPFTETGDRESVVIQGVLDLMQQINGAPYELELLTGGRAQSSHTFRQRFERDTGRQFTPPTFLSARLQLLDRADAMIVIRTGLSESGAFEVAYNVFGGNGVPIFFAIWEQAPLKTTLLRALPELVPVRYITFSRPEELRQPLLEFLRACARNQSRMDESCDRDGGIRHHPLLLTRVNATTCAETRMNIGYCAFSIISRHSH